jgi:hypothetical protein
MKNRHRVCQVVSKLVCSRVARRKILKQGAADRSEHRQAGGYDDGVRRWSPGALRNQAEAIKLTCISQNFNDRRARAAHSD